MLYVVAGMCDVVVGRSVTTMEEVFLKASLFWTLYDKIYNY